MATIVVKATITLVDTKKKHTLHPVPEKAPINIAPVHKGSLTPIDRSAMDRLNIR